MKIKSGGQDMKEIFLSYRIGWEYGDACNLPNWFTFEEFIKLAGDKNPSDYLGMEKDITSCAMMYYDYFHVQPNLKSGKGELYMMFSMNYTLTQFLDIYGSFKNFNTYFEDPSYIFKEILRISALRIDFITESEMSYIVKYAFRGICTIWYFSKDGFSNLELNTDLSLFSQFHHSTDLKLIFSPNKNVSIHKWNHTDTYIDEYFGEFKGFGSRYSLIT